MNFSERTAWNLSENDFASATREARSRGRELIDLTVSNPTACGFAYPADLLTSLAEPAAAQYQPDAFGMVSARDAVANYYLDLGAEIRRERIALTTSTSEAYSYLFRLLCNVGDEVLTAQPSYPLFDFIARLDGVILREFPLHYDPNAGPEIATDSSAWSIDLRALEAMITSRTRAIILVHPNNPTGNFVSDDEREAVQRICRQHDLALIVDEVFLDYALERPRQTFAGHDAGCLTFVLSGLSKVCALPQMKCSWIVTSGPNALVSEALARLEVIADTFLSMNTPIQHALPTWLSHRGDIQQQILSRMRENLVALDKHLAGTSIQRLAMQGGWTTVLRVPRTIDGIPYAEAALAGGSVVQPGEFYGLRPGRVVLSLLTPQEIWHRGLAALPLE
jgi:alanine-synthesizing transaminase